MKKNRIKISRLTGFAAAAGAVLLSAGAIGTVPVSAETTAANSYISKEAAKAAALNHAKVNASRITGYEIELDREWNGVFYEIEFNANGFEYDYKINAENGSIVKSKKEADDKWVSPVINPSKPVSDNSAVKYIGNEKAKAAALMHAGLKAGQITGFKIELDRGSGAAHYDIEFRANGYEYDYEINAASGKVMKFEKDTDDRYTGIMRHTDGSWIFVKRGVFDRSYTGVARSTTGNWVFAKNGRYDDSYTGVAKSTTGNWVYVVKGRFSTNAQKATGVARSTTGNYVYVKNGRFRSSYTGLAKSLNTGDIVYVKNGRYDTRYNGKAVYNGRTYNVRNGRAV